LTASPEYLLDTSLFIDKLSAVPGCIVIKYDKVKATRKKIENFFPDNCQTGQTESIR